MLMEVEYKAISCLFWSISSYARKKFIALPIESLNVQRTKYTNGNSVSAFSVGQSHPTQENLYVSTYAEERVI